MLEKSKANNPDLFKGNFNTKAKGKYPPNTFQSAMEKCKDFVNNRQGVKGKFPQESEERNVGNFSKKNRTDKENIEPPPQPAEVVPARPNHNPAIEKISQKWTLIQLNLIILVRGQKKRIMFSTKAFHLEI